MPLLVRVGLFRAGIAGIEALVAGINMDDNLGVGQSFADISFDVVAQLMGVFQRPFPGYD